MPTKAAEKQEAAKTEQGYEVRPLTHKDLKNLKGIIAEGADDAKKKLMEAAKEMGPGSEMSAGVTMFTAVLDQFDDVMYWLADLAGMDQDEFDNEPFDAHLDILYTLIERDNLPDFFGRYMRVRTMFSAALSKKSQ
jgi:hypothetical protein